MADEYGLSNRVFRPGETDPIPTGRSGPRKFYLRTGTIDHVDIDKYQLVIQWSDSFGSAERIPISFPYAGPAGMMGSLPEKGALGIFGFHDTGIGTPKPMSLSYLPAGLNAGLNYNTVKISPDTLPTTDINEIQHKFRKLSIGDMNFSSSEGGTVFLNTDVELHDLSKDSIVIRDDDESIISTSVNNFVFTDGVAISSGPAIRNFLKVYDDTGKHLDNNGSILPLRNKDNIYIVPFGEDITYGTKYYSEYRIDVEDLVDGKPDLNDINSASPVSTRDPLVTMAMGNYISADRFDDKLYGQILKADINFDNPTAAFTLGRAQQKSGPDEPSTVGLAYALHFLKSGCFIGVNKEGHNYEYIPATTSSGGGSKSILALGSLRESWGASAKTNNSWDLRTVGGIKWNVGAHNDKLSGRSIDITTSRGVSLDINGSDDDGYALKVQISGKFSFDIDEPLETNVPGLTSTIAGLKSENIGGSAEETVQSDKTVMVSGISSETVLKTKKNMYGVLKTTIVKGSEEKKVIRGDIAESITTFGKRKVDIVSGGFEDTLKTGTYKINVTTGSYKLKVGTGAVEIASGRSSVKLSAAAITVSATGSVKVEAPSITFTKKGGIATGVVTQKSHKDYTTGAPLKTSMSVKAA